MPSSVISGSHGLGLIRQITAKGTAKIRIWVIVRRAPWFLIVVIGHYPYLTPVIGWVAPTCIIIPMSRLAGRGRWLCNISGFRFFRALRM